MEPGPAHSLTRYKLEFAPQEEGRVHRQVADDEPDDVPPPLERQAAYAGHPLAQVPYSYPRHHLHPQPYSRAKPHLNPPTAPSWGPTPGPCGRASSCSPSSSLARSTSTGKTRARAVSRLDRAHAICTHSRTSAGSSGTGGTVPQHPRGRGAQRSVQVDLARRLARPRRERRAEHGHHLPQEVGSCTSVRCGVV